MTLFERVKEKGNTESINHKVKNLFVVAFFPIVSEKMGRGKHSGCC